MFQVTCSNEQKIKVTVTPETASGKPARIDGALKVSVQSGDGTFTQDPADALSFYAVSGDALADTVFLVEADADLGTGVLNIQDTVTLTVTGVNASSFGFTSAAPEAK